MIGVSDTGLQSLKKMLLNKYFKYIYCLCCLYINLKIIAAIINIAVNVISFHNLCQSLIML